MNKIQTLIDELGVEISKAQHRVDLNAYYHENAAQLDRGCIIAFEICIQKLTLLLNEETAKDLPKKACHCQDGKHWCDNDCLD